MCNYIYPDKHKKAGTKCKYKPNLEWCGYHSYLSVDTYPNATEFPKTSFSAVLQEQNSIRFFEEESEGKRQESSPSEKIEFSVVVSHNDLPTTEEVNNTYSKDKITKKIISYDIEGNVSCPSHAPNKNPNCANCAKHNLKINKYTRTTNHDLDIFFFEDMFDQVLGGTEDCWIRINRRIGHVESSLVELQNKIDELLELKSRLVEIVTPLLQTNQKILEILSKNKTFECSEEVNNEE